MKTQNIINSNESKNRVNNNTLPEWLKAGATVYSTKMWMYGDPFTIDGLSAYSAESWSMTAPNGFTFRISPEDLCNEFATVAPAPHDKQGREVPQPELHIGDRVILGEFFKTDKPNTEGTIWNKEWDEKEEAWLYRIRVADCVYYWGRADQVTPITPLEDTEEITDTQAEGIKVGDTVRHNKHEEVATVTAIREAFVNGCDGYRYLYTLDFGQSVTGPFGVELNGGEFLRETFTLCTPDGRELLPEPPAEVTISTDGEAA